MIFVFKNYLSLCYKSKIMTLSKIKIAREILLAFEFLGIPSYKFQELKNTYGGLNELKEAIEKMLGN